MTRETRTDENEQLTRWLAELLDDEECVLDHHGYCQTHFAGTPCVVPLIRSYLAARFAEEP